MSDQTLTTARTKLELALSLTDHPSTVALAQRYLRQIEWMTPGELGPNGYGPAFDDVLSAARFHGRMFPEGRRNEQQCREAFMRRVA